MSASPVPARVAWTAAATRGRPIALINPPWFDIDLDTLNAQYFTGLGFEVVHHGPCRLPSGQVHITPPALFDWVRTVATGAQGVSIAGNGVCAVDVIAALEEALGVPVLTGQPGAAVARAAARPGQHDRQQLR